jgi:hypothetical protein
MSTLSPMMPAGAAMMAAGLSLMPAANGIVPAAAPAVPAVPAVPAATPNAPVPVPRSERNEDGKEGSEAAADNHGAEESQGTVTPAARLDEQATVSALAASALFAAGFLWHGPTAAQRPRTLSRSRSDAKKR